jgi:hypothetical protein
MMTGMETTGTHKLQKVQARNEGFDINVIQVGSLLARLFNPHLEQDRIYLRDDSKGQFVELDQTLFNQLNSNTLTSKL